MHRLEVLVRLELVCSAACLHIPNMVFVLYRLIEMQAFLAELVEAFQFDLPKENIEIQKAVAGAIMVPIIRGKPELGATLPLRISLAS